MTDTDMRAGIRSMSEEEFPRVQRFRSRGSILDTLRCGSPGFYSSRCRSSRSRLWQRKPLALEEVGPEGGGEGSEYYD